MSNSSARPVQPRLWRSLAVVGATLGLAAAPATSGPVTVTLTPPLSPMLWQAQAEGGEGGEAGAVADATAEVAYLARLYIVEGHLLAALDLYRRGMADEAVGLSWHPEAEMMDEVREGLAAHHVSDVTPAMAGFSEAMERRADLTEVEAALAAAQAAFATAAAAADGPGTRREALVVLLRAAAHEYAESIEGGAVTDIMAYHESHAFLEIARRLVAELAADPAARAAADKALAAMQEADAAYGDMANPEPEARDPAILMSVAARVELALSSVR